MSAVTLVQRLTLTRLALGAFWSLGRTRCGRHCSSFLRTSLQVDGTGMIAEGCHQGALCYGHSLLHGGLSDRSRARLGGNAALARAQIAWCQCSSCQGTNRCKFDKHSLSPYIFACTDQVCRLRSPERQRMVSARCGQRCALRPGGPPSTLLFCMQWTLDCLGSCKRTGKGIKRVDTPTSLFDRLQPPGQIQYPTAGQ